MNIAKSTALLAGAFSLTATLAQAQFLETLDLTFRDTKVFKMVGPRKSSTSNANGRNPTGIEVVADYVNETLPSTGTTAFSANEINGGDCFHPSVSGQGMLSSGACFSNPR